MSWQLFGEAPFTPRDSAKVFHFQNDLWLSGGWLGSGIPPARDLWRSRDGRAWHQVLSQAPYEEYSGIASLNGRLFSIRKTAWVSNDGFSWTKITNSTPLGNLGTCVLLTAGGRLYLVGAQGMHSTTDGIVWQLEPFPDVLHRGSQASVVFGDKVTLIAGATYVANDPAETGYSDRTSHNDVWQFDGVTWTQLTASAPWSRRMWPGATVHCGRLFVAGGYDNIANRNIADTWVSDDGVKWTRYHHSTLFSERHYPAMMSTPNGIVLLGGNSWNPNTTVERDIWTLAV